MAYKIAKCTGIRNFSTHSHIRRNNIPQEEMQNNKDRRGINSRAAINDDQFNIYYSELYTSVPKCIPIELVITGACSCQYGVHTAC